MAKSPRIGGTFAPPLDEPLLTRYEHLTEQGGEKIREAMNKLVKLLRTFWQTPRSRLPGSNHPSGKGVIVPLEDSEIKRIWDDVPWMEELTLYGTWFEAIDPIRDRDLRNAAFHLLWYATELCLDREPITADQVQA